MQGWEAAEVSLADGLRLVDFAACCVHSQCGFSVVGSAFALPSPAGAAMPQRAASDGAGSAVGFRRAPLRDVSLTPPALATLLLRDMKRIGSWQGLPDG